MDRGGKEEEYTPGIEDRQAPLRLRHTIDWRKINDRMTLLPINTTDPKEILAKMGGSTMVSLIDVSGAFHALKLDPRSQLISGFESGLPSIGRLQYTRAAMGISQSSQWLQAALIYTLGEARNFCLPYCDDLIVFGNTEEEMLNNLAAVFDLLRIHGWRVKRSKLSLFINGQIEIFGLLLDIKNQTLSPIKSKVTAIRDRPIPKTKQMMKSFLGALLWNSAFLKGHAEYTKKLHSMTHVNTSFEWTEERKQAYEWCLAALQGPDCFIHLAHPKLPFEIWVDASEFYCGFFLCQVDPDNQQRKILGYHSRIFSERESRTCAFERESLAALTAIRTYWAIIEGRTTTLYSDSRNAVFLNLMSKSNSKVCRYNEFISGLTWLKQTWIPAKDPNLRLADFLSHSSAMPKGWVNKQIKKEDT